MKNILILLALTFLVGCALPLRPGRANFKSPSGVVGSVRQSQNPQEPSIQIWERIQEPPAGRTTERVTTTIGAAQKDTARELGAKLASLRPVMYIGILVFLFGAASFVYPPLKLIVASVTTSAVITIAGLAMIVLPVLVIGNEALILGVAGGGAALWWFAHRHGGASTKAKLFTDTLKKI